MKKLSSLLKLLFILFILFSSAYLMAYDNYQVQMMTIVKNNEEKVNSLSQQMSYLQDKCSSLELKVSQLKQAFTTERQNNAQIQSDMTMLRQQLGEDKAQMQKSLSTAVDKIASETSKAISGAAKTSKNAQASTSAATGGKFYVYKVQEGATLATVAKAYKVPVESIKKANKLKDNTLSVGQVLYIPKTN